MGDVSSTEQGLNHHPTSPERKPTPDEIADKFLANRKRYQEHIAKLRAAEAEEDVSEVADKIEAAGIEADFDKEQEKLRHSQAKTNPIKLPAAPTPIITLQKEQQPTESSTTKQKFKDFVGNSVWKARQAYTVVSQFGGIHPSRHEGKWVWVLEPWARFHDDPRQRGYSNESDHYAKLFSSVKGRTIHMTELAGENPSVVPDGASGGIKLMDHRRIHEARRAGKAIEVNMQRPDGNPMSYN